MRRSILILIASLALAYVATPFVSRAQAEDAPDDKSAAGTAYREAWWAETAGGNLTQAVELYTKAVDSEGPASVKARALYRKAVVLQRIGKTEEAIRTLERLAKDHPGEAAVQTDARARLAEWTAVDLKTSFAEWYRRYQYSPEFQAKIVDLVLKLGAAESGTYLPALNEILMIGAPAIPALRQRLGQSISERVTTALLMLGDVPPADVLRVTLEWRNRGDCWAAIRMAPAEARARLRSELKPDQPWDQGMLAMFEGPLSVFAWANTPAAKDVGYLFLVYGLGLDEKGKMQADVAAARPLLLALVENKALYNGTRNLAAYWLFAVQGVDVALAEAWAGGNDAVLRAQGLSFLVDPRGGHASWPSLRRLLKVAPKWEMAEPKSSLFAGVIAGIDEGLVDTELDQLADDLLPLVPWGYLSLSYPLSAAARTLVARMIDRARELQVANQLLSVWQRPGGEAEANLDRLAGWARSAQLDDARQAATRALTNSPNGGPQRALAMLSEADLAPATRLRVFSQLMVVNSPANRSLLLDPPSRRAILATLRTQEGEGSEGDRRLYVGQFLVMASQASLEGRRAAAEEWLVDPVTYPRSLLRKEYLAWGGQPYVQAAWRTAMTSLWPAWMKAWASWTPAQRDAAIEGIGAMDGSVESSAFLAACARDRANRVSSASRAVLLTYVTKITLDDLRLAFDLSTQKGTDAAIQFTTTADVPNPTPAGWFEALKLGLRRDGPGGIARAMLERFQYDPQAFRPLIEALLAHHDDAVRENAVATLAERESSDDLPLWLMALSLPSIDVRVKAATGLGRIAHPDATKALVKALDDPNSRVRDAAIASLEAIQKIEDLKRTWREKVR